MNMVFYEIEHGIANNHFLYERHFDHSFPLHMHRCYEMVLLLDGEMTIQVDQQEYCLHAGDLMLIKPHRIHSYHTQPEKHSECALCVFSEDLIAAITEPLTKYRLTSLVLHHISALHRDLFLDAQKYSDIAEIKGFLYLLCSQFCKQLNTEEEDIFASDNGLLRDMFIYIENNVDKPCTLHELAKALRYNEAYLSRMFHKSVGIPYSEYVRNIKINHACYLLHNTDESVFNVSMRCGYSTQSSFYRSFKQLVGMNPNEYRLKKASSPI